MASFTKDDYHQLLSFKEELRKIPDKPPTTAKETRTLIEELIRTGRSLERLFSFAEMSEWQHAVTETLIEYYGLWTLGLATLLRSGPSKEHKLKYRYATLTEDDGVSGPSSLLLNPDTQMLNRGTRAGVRSKGEKKIVTNTEGIKQVKSALKHLKKKLQCLSSLLNSNYLDEIKASERQRIITRHESDGYWFRDKRIEFKSADTLYFKLFECLFDNTNKVVSYDRLDVLLEKHSGKRKNTKAAKRDRIRNARAELFRRSTLPKTISDSNKKTTETIETARDEGFKFNNPFVDD